MKRSRNMYQTLAYIEHFFVCTFQAGILDTFRNTDSGTVSILFLCICLHCINDITMIRIIDSPSSLVKRINRSHFPIIVITLRHDVMYAIDCFTFKLH